MSDNSENFTSSENSKDNIEAIKERIRQKQEKLRLAEEKFKSLQPPYKILTRKEMAEIERKKLEKERKEFEELKANIYVITEEALGKAKKLRLDALNKDDYDREKDEKTALRMEIRALRREVEVLGCIFKEKNELCDNLLAEKICEQYNLKKLRFCKNPELEDKVKLNSHISNIKRLTDSYIQVRKEVMNLDFRMRKSSERLNSKSIELLNY